MQFGLVFFVFFMLLYDPSESQDITILDEKFNPFFRWIRRVVSLFVQPESFDRALELNLKHGKLQREYSNDTKFFCDVIGPGARSKSVPESVHMLRPGDIDVIGAIGDSITAGSGIFALNELQVLLDARGASWAGGGRSTWRKFLTTPNMLKEFNPKLYGYSEIDHGLSFHKSARFNVAGISVRSNLEFIIEKSSKYRLEIFIVFGQRHRPSS